MIVLLFTMASLCGMCSLIMFWRAFRLMRDPEQLPCWMQLQNAMLFFFLAMGEARLAVTFGHSTDAITAGLFGVAFGIGLASLVTQVSLLLSKQNRKPHRGDTKERDN